MSIIVRGAPQEYVCRPGCWNDLENHLQQRNIRYVLVLHGNLSWKCAKPYFPTLNSVKHMFMYYGKKCTDERIDHFAAIVKDEKIDAIIAVGGGKITDLAKAAANHARVPAVVLPTQASTCAAWTPLSVVYREDGSMDRVCIFDTANLLVLVDPIVILHSPIEHMIAGIGDTLAKWYESDCIISQMEVKPVAVQVAVYAAMRCREVLLADSQRAIQGMKENMSNQEFLNVVESIIMLGGMVGGFGDEYGRISGAHTIHDALTILPQCQKLLHGCVVAYSILVQLCIEQKWHEIDELIPFYRSLGLPTCLADLKLEDATPDDLKAVAESAAAQGTAIHLMRETINAKVIQDAMQNLELHVAKKD